MEHYKAVKQQLSDLRNEILTYIGTKENPQDLMDKFLAVKQKDEDIYELILLIYQDIQTHNKISKKKLTNIIDKLITAKINTIDIILEEKLSAKKDTDLTKKLLNMVTFDNVIKLIGLATAIYLLLFTLNYISPETFKGTNSGIVETVHKVNEGEK